ncbi:GNAT family N-acetyltransferase [Paenochrobactrum pullorum]|uniref:GNAT family N-acetyltransferase n=1 Tax=Paenochrobactrum pullorum TaxID=1324351 RepID=UPI0035BC5DCD
MVISIVTTKERPELAQITGAWRWEAFFSDTDVSLQDVVAIDVACTSEADILPTVWVLLKDEQAIGMITLCLDDLENRPELNPWLAGLYIVPQYRGQGHALQLIAHLETEAAKAAIKRLSLYTEGSVGLYSKAGWNVIETFDEKGGTYSIMQKQFNLS